MPSYWVCLHSPGRAHSRTCSHGGQGRRAEQRGFSLGLRSWTSSPIATTSRGPSHLSGTSWGCWCPYRGNMALKWVTAWQFLLASPCCESRHPPSSPLGGFTWDHLGEVEESWMLLPAPLCSRGFRWVLPRATGNLSHSKKGKYCNVPLLGSECDVSMPLSGGCWGWRSMPRSTVSQGHLLSLGHQLLCGFCLKLHMNYPWCFCNVWWYDSKKLFSL